MKYSELNHMTYRDDPKNGPELIANFTARITEEIYTYDGVSGTKQVVIEGTMQPLAGDQEPRQLPPITMSDTEFLGMKWHIKQWGIGCVIMPGSGAASDLQTHLQLSSKPSKRSIYRHTGWTELDDGRNAYLHTGGAITEKGNDDSVTVELPPEMAKYDLSCPVTPKESVDATLRLLTLATPDITYPLVIASLAPLFGPVDFGVHITGRTGSFKSELMALCQSHYGSGFDARHLPGSWSSSDNALEALAFLAKNAAFVIDDFVPHGSSWQQRAYQGKAERLIRAQGNQAGRQRMSDTTEMKTTMFPRGCILSTGEDTPEGHSVRGRMLIRELSAGTIKPNDLTRCQRDREAYPGTVAWLAQSLAQEDADLKPRVEQLRDETYRGTGHGRTPTMLAKLQAVWEECVTRWMAAGFIAAREGKRQIETARSAIREAGSEQASYLEEADPVDLFMAALRESFANGKGHARTPTGGIPINAEQLGWERQTGIESSVPTYKARGKVIGWASKKQDALYLDMTAGLGEVMRLAKGDIPLTKATLVKRLKEAGKLIRTDDTRARNTIRVTCEEHPRTVIALSLSEVLGQQETADEAE